MRVFEARVFVSYGYGLWHAGLGWGGEWRAAARAQVAALCSDGEAGGAFVHERWPFSCGYVSSEADAHKATWPALASEKFSY